MEHDIEKKIREKILHAEQQPTRWRKDDVWNKLNPGKVSRKTPVAFYYAAASVCLLAAVIIFSVQRRYDNATALALKTLQLSIESVRAEQENVGAQNVEENNCPQNASSGTSRVENIAIVKSQVARIKKSVVEQSEKQPDTAVPSIEVARVTEEIKVTEQPVVDVRKVDEMTAPKSTVSTIFVVVTEEPKKEVRVTKTKRMRFNLFRSEKNNVESGNKSQDDSQILVARIN